MNPNVILITWTNFNVVFDSAFLTNKEKAAIGAELLRTLPHEGMYASCDATVVACHRSIKDRIASLEANEQDSVLAGPADSTGEGEATVQPKATRKPRK